MLDRSVIVPCALVALAGCGRDPSDASTREPDAAPVAAPVLPAGPIDRGDGLIVEILAAGAGAEVGASSRVTMHYRTFVEGAEKPFDATAGVPLEISLGERSNARVIPGLARGLIGLSAGTKAKISIPPALGYGADGNPAAGVPADSALVCEVHVVDVR